MFPDPLRAFQRVVQAGSIRKASDELQLAPSSVSRQIAILERQMGTQLFTRTLTGISLTHAGQLVADYADLVIGGFDSLRFDIDDLRGRSRLISVAMVESITAVGPAEAAKRFRTSFDHVTFNFDILPAPAVIEAVKAKKYDLGVTFAAQIDPMISTIGHVKEPLVLLVPVGHPLAERSSITVRDLKDYPLALPPRTFGLRRIFDKLCLEQGMMIQPVVQSSSFEALRDFVRVGAGVAFLPSRATYRLRDAGKGVALPFDESELNDTTLDLIIPKISRLPRLVRLYADLLQETLTEYE